MATIGIFSKSWETEEESGTTGGRRVGVHGGKIEDAVVGGGSVGGYRRRAGCIQRFTEFNRYGTKYRGQIHECSAIGGRDVRGRHSGETGWYALGLCDDYAGVR